MGPAAYPDFGVKKHKSWYYPLTNLACRVHSLLKQVEVLYVRENATLV